MDAGDIEWPGGTNSSSIAFVHQDLGLVPTLSVAENIALATRFKVSFGKIDWRSENRDAEAILAAYGIAGDASQPVGAFGPAEQTMIAIARALASLPNTGGALVLDEPTARLPVEAADKLLALIANLKRQGVAILYITHRLNEVIEIADEVTILRDGQRVYHGPVVDVDRAKMTRMIVGREIEKRVDATSFGMTNGAPTLIQADGLMGVKLRGVSLDVRRGEILGIAGLVGSGRSELGRMLFGLQHVREGKVTLEGEDITNTGPSVSVERGLAYVPQERGTGIFPVLSVAENCVLAELSSLMSGFALSAPKMRAAARKIVSDLLVRASSVDVAINTLSGGNQQKVSIGKWLRRDVSLLILDEPTQGIDVGARAEIFRIVRELARTRRISALVLDSDLDILADHCDRVLVMVRGRITRTFEGHDLSASALSHEVYGH